MRDLSWQKRLAIVLSVVWLGLIAAWSSSESSGLSIFLLFGVMPIAFLWGVAWVWLGFRKQRTKTKAPLAESQSDSSVSRKTHFLWVAAILSAVGIGIYYHAVSKTGYDIPYKFGELTGTSLGVGVLAYVLWKFLFKMQKGAGLLSFAIIFLAVSISMSHTMIREHDEAKAFLGNAQQMMLKYMNGETVDKEELLKAGQYSPLLLKLHDNLSGIMRALQEYSSHVDASRLETILSPETLQHLAAINNAISTMASLSTQVDKLENEINLQYALFQQEIDLVDGVPYSVKEDFKRGALDGIKHGQASFKAYYEIQRSMIASAIELLEFMKSRQGKYIYQADQLLFANDVDAQTYNQYIQLIQSIALKESEWRNVQSASLFQKMGELEDMRSKN